MINNKEVYLPEYTKALVISALWLPIIRHKL